jgi:hypothetical protein
MKLQMIIGREIRIGIDFFKDIGYMVWGFDFRVQGSTF